MTEVVFQSFDSFKEDLLKELDIIEQYVEAARDYPLFLTDALRRLRKLKKRVEATEVV